jgi:hypothetical protein
MNILITFCKFTDSIYAGVVRLHSVAFKTKYRKKQRKFLLPLIVQERRVSMFAFSKLQVITLYSRFTLSCKLRRIFFTEFASHIPQVKRNALPVQAVEALWVARG